jgi:hypothetical protein
LRVNNPIFAGNELEVVETFNDHVLGYFRIDDHDKALVLANFSDREQIIPDKFLETGVVSGQIIKHLKNRNLSLYPYDFICVLNSKDVPFKL